MAMYRESLRVKAFKLDAPDNVQREFVRVKAFKLDAPDNVQREFES